MAVDIIDEDVINNDVADNEFDNIPDCDLHFPGDEEVDNMLESNKFLRFFATSKKFYSVISFLCALTMVCQFYIQKTTFLPEERELLSENLYSGSELDVSDEDLDGIITNIENVLGITIDDDFKDEYCLLNAVLENPNLSDTEKDVFLRLENIIKDNPYIDKEAAYHSLLNVEVLYKKRPLSLKKNVEGVYVDAYESIGVFVEDPENRILIHEMIHCVFCNEKTKDLPTYFSEGVTELLANEYFSDTPFVELVNYPFEIVVVKMLCEVSSPEAVLKAYSTGDMSAIAKEMALVYGTEEEAMSALDMLDYTMRQFRDELVDGEDELDKNTLLLGYIPLFRDIIEKNMQMMSHYKHLITMVKYYLLIFLKRIHIILM